MESIAKIGFAAFGAVGGFVIGVILAGVLGAHEKLPLMASGLAAATILAVIGLRLSSRTVGAAPTRTRKASIALAGVLIGAVALFFLFIFVGL